MLTVANARSTVLNLFCGIHGCVQQWEDSDVRIYNVKFSRKANANLLLARPRKSLVSNPAKLDATRQDSLSNRHCR